MSQFAAALSDALEADTTDVDTTDAVETETGADADAGESDATDTEDVPAERAAEASEEAEDDAGGSWFEPKKDDGTKKDEKQPAAQQAAPVDDKKQKKMPDAVRTRIEAEVRQKLEAERPWAQGWSNDEGAQVRELWELGKRDIVSLVDRVIRAAYANPVTRGTLHAYFDNIGLVPKGQGQQPADADPMPNVANYSTAEGITHEGLQKYNHDLTEWNKRQVLKEVEQRMAPLVGARQQAQREAEMQATAHAYADRATKDIQVRPGFRENAKAIQAAYNAIPRPWQGNGETAHPQFREERELLLEAYYTVMTAQQKAVAKKALAADLKKKQDVGSVNPQGGQGGSTEKKPKSFLDALKQESSRSR